MYARWLIPTLTDWLIIIGSYTIANLTGHLWAYYLASLVIGNRMHGLAIMGHEASHRHAPDWLANTLVFYALNQDISSFRKMHFAHHKYLGSPKDPEQLHKRCIEPDLTLPITAGSFARSVLMDFTGGHLPQLVDLRIILPIPLISAIPMNIAVFTIAAYFDALWVPALWYFSMATSFWGFFKLRAWIEHVGTEGTRTVHLPLWAELIFTPHGALYHWEHHHEPGWPAEVLRIYRHFNEPMTLRRVWEEYTRT